MAGRPPPFALEGLDHVVLLVDNMAEAERFYREVIGCTVEGSLPQYGMLQLRAGAALIDVVAPTSPRTTWRSSRKAFAMARGATASPSTSRARKTGTVTIYWTRDFAGAFSPAKESHMATDPIQPEPTVQPTQPPPEVAPPQHDVDVPAPSAPPASPGVQPSPD